MTPSNEDSFANTPVSIGELKSDKTGKAKDWSVRDMLVFLLRDIDSGGPMAKADKCVLCVGFIKNDGASSTTGWRAGVFSEFEALGIVQQCLHNMAAE